MWVVKKWEWEQVFLYVKKNVSHGKKNNQTSKRKIDKFYLSKKKEKKAQICHAIFHHIIVFGSSARGKTLLNGRYTNNWQNTKHTLFFCFYDGFKKNINGVEW